MKVLILINYSGGLYRQRFELIQKMLDTGYEVYFSSPDEEKVTELIKMGCKFEACTYNRHGANPFKEFALLLAYKKLICRVSPDIVLTYTIKPNVYGGIVCSRLHIPYVANITGLGTAVENRGIMKKLTLMLYHLGLKNAKKVFFQNSANLAFMQEQHILHGLYDLLPGSGVNLEQNCYEPYPEDNGTETFLFIGRLMKDKGIEELVLAAERICTKYKNVRFVAVGFCEPDYQTELKKLNADRYISMVGEQKNVHEWITQANAIVHPSYHEGMSNALLEAASSGRPILASDVPGCRETFDEGISGFGFKPRDVDSLCEVIEKFIAVPYEAKAEMGQKGRKKMEKEFDRNIVVEKYMNEIKSIAKE